MLELLVVGLLTAVGQGALAFEPPTIWAHDCGAPVAAQGGWTLDCAVTNRGPVALARLTGETLLKDPERTVPWAQAEFDMQVPGGIEPQETRHLTLPHPDPTVVPEGFAARSLVRSVDGMTADGRSITELVKLREAVLERAQARRRRAEQAAADTKATTNSLEEGWPFEDPVADALERALEGATPNPGSPMTEAEQSAFRVSVQQCWNVDVGTEAARVTLTVEFDMDEQGRVAGDVRKVSATGGGETAIEAAFQSARRAILRCQRDGYVLPAGKYDQWRTMEMTFDPSGMRMR